jgi:hypothetical protein
MRPHVGAACSRSVTMATGIIIIIVMLLLAWCEVRLSRRT